MNAITKPAITSANTIPLQVVESSRLHAVGYDGGARILAVRFHPRRDGVAPIYHYFDVAPEAFERLMKAPSIGVHFGAHVMGAYEYRKIEPVVEQDPPAESTTSGQPSA